MTIPWLLMISFLAVVPVVGMAQANCTPAALNTEILTGPLSAELAPYVAAGNDAAVLQLLTMRRTGAAYVVSKGVVTKDTAMGTWADVIRNIRVIADANKKDQWTWDLEKFFLARAQINYADPLTLGFFQLMVQDQLLTSAGVPITPADITARTTRDGSRAEVLCGSLPEDMVTLAQVSCALRNFGCP